jgi:hypothetical protein
MPLPAWSMMEKDLAEFLQDSFGSVWSLEILLVLHRQPERVWTAEDLIAELRSSQVVVQQGIDNLLAAGLIVAEDGGAVRYGPASAGQDALVRRLEDAYRVKPAAVRRLIIQSPAEKLRTFADAFKIVKD